MRNKGDQHLVGANPGYHFSGPETGKSRLRLKMDDAFGIDTGVGVKSIYLNGNLL